MNTKLKKLLWTTLGLIMLLFLPNCAFNKKTDVQITTDPPAKILIDGKNSGYGSIKTSLKMGSHKVTAILDGYETQLRTIEIENVDTIYKTLIKFPILLPEIPPLPDDRWYQGLSADNKWIAIEGPRLSNNNIWVSETTRINWIPLLPTPEKYTPQAVWSPDGSKLAVELSNGQIWIFQTGQWDNHTSINIDLSPYRNSLPIWSPDNKHIAIHAIGSDPYIWLCDLDGNCAPILGKNEAKPMEEGQDDPIWSPDGKYILYVVFNGPYSEYTNIQIWILNIETHDRTILFETDNFIHYPIWSPDGEKIAFAGWDWKKVFIYDFKKGELNTILGKGSDHDLGDSEYYYYLVSTWSSDGQSLAFTYGKAVFTIKLSTGKVRQIAEGDCYIERWTSDGNNLIIRDHDGIIKYLQIH